MDRFIKYFNASLFFNIFSLYYNKVRNQLSNKAYFAANSEAGKCY